MPLFPDIFSTQELNRLRQELALRDSKIQELANSLTAERQTTSQVQTLLEHHKQLLEDSERTIRAARDQALRQAKLNEANSAQAAAEILQLKADVDTAIEICKEIELERDAAKENADQLQKVTQRLQAELAATTPNSLDRDAEFTERESRLQEKSKKLVAERQAFQLQAQKLYAREQAWRVNIEPRLRDFEEHQALEAKRLELTALDTALWQRDEALRDLKKDLDRRNCSDIELSKREIDLFDLEQRVSERERAIHASEADLERELATLSDRKSSLDRQAEQLSQFQSEVDRIEENLVSIANRERQLAEALSREKAGQRARTIELRQEHAALRRDERRLNSVKARLDAREAIVGERETQFEKLKTDRRELRRRVKECVAENEAVTRQLEIAMKKIKLTTADLIGHTERITYRDGQITSLILERDALRVKLDECNRSRRAFENGRAVAAVRHDAEKTIERKDSPPPPPPDLRAESPLTAHDYRVGVSGIVNDEARRAVLKKIIGLQYRNLQKVGPEDYMAQWGEANSDDRIWCIAHQLSWNVNFQGAKESLGRARKHWLDDLRWLTKHYKRSIPDSHWPKVPKA